MEKSTRASVTAGVVASIAAVVFFTIVHWFFVFPILDILVLGLFIVPPVGIAAGWAFDELPALRRRFAGHLEGPVFGLVLFATLLPIAALAATHGDVDPNELSGAELARLVIELMLLFPIGMGFGWAMERRLRPAIAVGIAALAAGLTIGHNVPILGASPVAVKMYLVILITEVVAATVLAETRRILLARARSPTS